MNDLDKNQKPFDPKEGDKTYYKGEVSEDFRKGAEAMSEAVKGWMHQEIMEGSDIVPTEVEDVLATLLEGSKQIPEPTSYFCKEHGYTNGEYCPWCKKKLLPKSIGTEPTASLRKAIRWLLPPEPFEDFPETREAVIITMSDFVLLERLVAKRELGEEIKAEFYLNNRNGKDGVIITNPKTMEKAIDNLIEEK